MAKRNIKALKRLRKVFADVPSHLVHMLWVEDTADCGTVHCLYGWGLKDPVLTQMGMPDYPYRGAEFFGLTTFETDCLFADQTEGEQALIDVRMALRRDPHAVTKDMVLASLDDAIEGRPIKPYVVKS